MATKRNSKKGPEPAPRRIAPILTADSFYATGVEHIHQSGTMDAHNLTRGAAGESMECVNPRYLKYGLDPYRQRKESSD